MDIKSELISVIKDYTDVPSGEIDTSLGLKFLGINSYVVLSMISEIENRFNVSIPDSDLYNFQTLDDIIGYLEKKTV